MPLALKHKADDTMKIKRRPSLMLLLAATLLVLLPLLAVLQYRWLGEVSAGERERMQTNLRTSADRFCADFDRELTNVYGLRLAEKTGSSEMEAQVDALIAERNEARKQKQWARSDQIREQLKEMGVTIEDSKAGTKWRWG